MSSASSASEQVQILVRQNEKLASALSAARDELAKMDERLEALASPPSPYGIYIQAEPDNTATILMSGRYMQVVVERVRVLSAPVRSSACQNSSSFLKASASPTLARS